MARDKDSPLWASGPGELLKHGLSVLREDSDSNRRIAMICIDNSVELMIKTFLGLPSRITGIMISRKDYADYSESFPRLLDALQTHASDKIKGIDIGEIEWFHRLRNQLYHEGNGLTVERNNVEVYAEVANLLFLNLFGTKLVSADDDNTGLLGNFMQAWIRFEQTVGSMAFIMDEKRHTPVDALRALRTHGIINETEFFALSDLRRLRNDVVHGQRNHKNALSAEVVNRLRNLTEEIERRTLQE
jgi:hypothetical protein